jgi:glycopeptide antibiotics resistance protein
MVLWILLFLYLLIIIEKVFLERIRWFQLFPFMNEEYLRIGVNLIPFKTIGFYVSNWNHINVDTIIRNLLGNFVMLAPLGVLFPILFPKFQQFKKFIITILVFNLGIELIHLVTNLGSFDIDDIILNTSGALIAFGSTKSMFKFSFFQKLIEKQTSGTEGKAFGEN